MDNQIVIHCISLVILLTYNIEAHVDNGTDSIPNDALRVPRVSGRIVKVYSGTRPDPVHCTGEGFQGDPKNCALFYRCMKSGNGKFTVYKFQCGPGTVYDPDKEVCNHPRSTRRTECGGLVEHLSNDQTHMNEVQDAPEIPSPIVTKQPVYTESTITSNKPIITTTRSTQVSTVSPISTSTKRSTMNDVTKTTIHPTVVQIYDTTIKKIQSPWVVSTMSSKPSLSTGTIQLTETSSVTRQPSPPNDDICFTDGFMGDSKNCRKFYRCVSDQRGRYIKYEFSCSESTMWDDDIQGCNHPWAVKRSRCGRSSSDNNYVTVLKSTTENIPQQQPTTQPNEIKNIQYLNNEIRQQQTPINYELNVSKMQTQTSGPALQIHNQISNGSAISEVQTNNDEKDMHILLQIDHSKHPSKNHLLETTTKTTIRHNIAKGTDTTKSIKNGSSNECTESGFMGDNNDCKTFYRCVDNGKGSFTRYEFSCSEGTVWDPKIEACNHEWAVKECGSKVSTDIIGQTTEPATTHVSQNYNASSTIPAVLIDEDVNSDGGYGNQIHQQTTTKNSTPTSTQNYYNPTSSTAATPVDENIDDDNGYGNHIEQENTRPFEETTPKPSINENNECQSSGFVGDANDCKKFYRCVDNGRGSFTKYEFQCGEGTVWDPDIKACNHAWAVKNCGSHNDKVNMTTNSEIIDSTTEVQSTISTQRTTQSLHQNDEDDAGYNGSHDNEVPYKTSTTKRPQTIGANYNCQSSGFMGDENDCKKFYRCVDNGDGSYTRYEFECGEGTVWDTKIDACNHAWAVEKCGSAGTGPLNNENSSESPPTIGYEENDNGYSTLSDKNTDRPMQSTSTIKTTISHADFENSICKKSGFMGDSQDCKKFYRCVDNGDGSYVRYEFLCGEGTVWDPEIEACNHAWAVEKCGSASESIGSNAMTSSESPIWSDEEINNGYPSQNNEELNTTTQSTTKQPVFESTTELNTNSNAICKYSGFMGDKIDCKKFYRCVDDGKGNYIKYEFNCGEGTAWDQRIESCNHAESVTNCGKGMNQSMPDYSESSTQHIPSTIESDNNGYNPQPTEGSSSTSTIEAPQEISSDICKNEGFFGDKNDCKKFYRCVDNNSGGFIKYEFVCGEGTVWVQDIQACDHATLDQPCGGSINDISKEPIHENDDIYTETSIKTTTSTAQATESIHGTEKPQLSSSLCKAEGFFGNANDCTKFYRCVDNGKNSFTKYDFTCGEGTFWDQDILACNHKTENNSCKPIQMPSTSDGSESHIESSSSGGTTTAIAQQSSTETTQPNSTTGTTGNDCNSDGFFANSNDCTKFVRCVSNGNGGYIKYEFSCGEGTVWVQDIQACDYDDGTCNNGNGSTKPPKEHQSTIQISDSTTSTSSTVSQVSQNQNDEYSDNEAGQCSSAGFYADKNDCKRFYRCVDNGNGGYTKYDFECGEGTAWDDNIQGCNHISEVKSCQTSVQGETHTQSIMQDEEVSPTTENTSTTKQTISSTTESTSAESNNKCEKQGYFGNTQDCKQFYRCVDDGNGGLTKYEFSCGEGTIWDQDLTTCNHPEDVTNPSCKQTQSSTTSASSSDGSQALTSTTETTQASASTTESSNQNSNNCSQEQSSKKPVNKDITCNKAGFYGDPNDCKKFYRCVDWDGDGRRFSVYHFDCGEGTIWDPALDTCNHEESVYPPRDCSGAQSQNENITEDTTKTSQETTTTDLSTQQPPSTTEQSTTQQTVTSDQTTTQQSTSSEQTTVQQGTTSEITTTQQETTSEPTTTSKSTTSEQTTTQESTTSEQTTTQKTTSSEATTAQQSTTSEQTTTQQSTTNEQATTQQTTTQESTTSEQTTTQKTTSSEATTAQPSTTSEQTTTQQSATEQTTTQNPTTTEQTTSQQSTTTEEATTDHGATEESTTSQQTTTQQPTNNEQTTSDQTTTSESTTSESTTEELTTSEQSTTTQQQTSDASTTESAVTEQSSSTTQQSSDGTTTTESNVETSTDDGSSQKECPDTEDDQYLYVCPTSFRRHPKYCNLFYQCTEDNDNHDSKIAVFTCPNNTIYDETKTQCVEEEKADKKCNGEIAQRRRFKRLDANYKEPIVVGVEKQACPTVGNLPFEKKAECSPAFLKCSKTKSGALRGFVHKCPEGYVFWSISRRCELIANISDCKSSNNNWEKRWEIPTEKTNIDSYKYKLMKPSFK